MKLIYRIIILIVMLMSFSSCVNFEAITFANGKVYTDFDAYVAYDVYYDLYENGICENKPIIILKNND